jgi:hypothetical protein
VVVACSDYTVQANVCLRSVEEYKIKPPVGQLSSIFDSMGLHCREVASPVLQFNRGRSGEMIDVKGATCEHQQPRSMQTNDGDHPLVATSLQRLLHIFSVSSSPSPLITILHSRAMPCATQAYKATALHIGDERMNHLHPIFGLPLLIASDSLLSASFVHCKYWDDRDIL